MGWEGGQPRIRPDTRVSYACNPAAPCPSLPQPRYPTLPGRPPEIQHVLDEAYAYWLAYSLPDEGALLYVPLHRPPRATGIL